MVPQQAAEEAMVTIGYRLKGVTFELEQSLREAHEHHLAGLSLSLDSALLDVARAIRKLDGSR